MLRMGPTMDASFADLVWTAFRIGTEALTERPDSLAGSG